MARAHGTSRMMRILFLTGRYPFPPLKGDQLRAFHQIERLAKRHRVTLLSLAGGKGAAESDPLPDLCEHVVTVKAPGVASRGYGVVLNLVTGSPLQNGLFRSTAVQKAYANLVRGQGFDVVMVQLMRMVQYVEGDVSAPVVVDLVDSMGLNMSIRVSRARTAWERWFWRLEQRRSASYERRVCSEHAASIVVSERDREFIGAEGVVVIPNGVAMDVFQYRREGRETNRIAFWGNLRYFSNRDAVETLVRRVMPRIWESRPDTIVDVIGPSPPQWVAGSADARVHAPGFVDDLPSRIRIATIGLFPIWEASGMQNKVLEALASGLPVVTTPGVVAGIGARPEEEIFVGHTAEELADQALRLLGDQELQEKLAQNGRRLIEERYTWERSTGHLEELLIRSTRGQQRGPAHQQMDGG